MNSGSGNPCEASAARELLAQTLARLDRRINRERMQRQAPWRVSLAPVRELLGGLGDPHLACAAVHVAGSKGKGSVAALIAAGLGRAGASTLLYTSPHVERIHERVRLDGECVGDDDLRRALAVVLDAQDAAATGADTPDASAAEASWFDLVTAAAFWLARERRVDWLIAECGLGGRLDSTNVLEPRLGVITSIELEHTAILGSTRAAIAAEKAGILKPGVPLVCGLPADDEAGAVIAERARELDCPVHRPPAHAPGAGFEAANLALARTALEVLGGRGEHARGAHPASGRRGSAHAALAAALLDAETAEGARLPGREEVFSHRGTPVLVDGAHVASSIAGLLAHWRGRPGFAERPVVVLGTARDKDLAALLKALDGEADRLICTSVGGDLHRRPDEIAAAAKGLQVAVETAPSPVEALQRAVEIARSEPTPTWVLVVGSLYLAGAVRPTLAATGGTAC